MKKLILLSVVLFVPHYVFAEGGEKIVSFSFRDAPLFQVLPFYEDLTGQTVTVERAMYPGVSMRPDTRLTTSEAISLIESNLYAIGIVVEKNESGITMRPEKERFPEDSALSHYPYERVTTQRTATHNPKGSYAERRRQRLEKKSENELNQHLQDYQMEVIRSGLPPLENVETPAGEEP